ncbi:MAG: glycosyltransferase [Ignavibacteria bacterium]|nr:glycosyltransferase [Ignavibacteria bacterium]
MRILFHSNAISVRGTEVALFDYAHFNEEILGNKSIIAANRNNQNNHPEAVKKFEKRFGNIFWYNDLKELNKIISETKSDIFYAIKHGNRDGILVDGAKNCIHCVFREIEPHGDVYAVISEWMSKVVTGGKCDYVPHILNLPDVKLHFREYLKIPTDAVVFGRYGGTDTFDIDFVKETVKTIARERKNIYFIFMNTENFLDGEYFENIKFVAGTADDKVKVVFINTCDAMLHARLRGETFGIAVGEFSIKNKPVITFARSPEQAHFWHLKEKGIYYFDDEQLFNILLSFKPNNKYNYDAFSQDFSPEKVMQRFKDVFIDG